MGWLELFVMAVGLSMDAFAVSICTGLSMDKITVRKSAIVGLYFGVFQALMPLIGYFLGIQFAHHIKAIDHWIAFVLLLIIGGKMLRDSFSPEADSCEKVTLQFKEMFPLAVATSIDALAVGVSLAFLSVNIVPAVSLIGIVTFVISVIGVKIGHLFGCKFKAKAEFVGGAILIVMGTKILLEHTVFL